MLANGTKFGYKEKGASGDYTDISEDLKEVPELGGEPEMVDNSGLNDKNKRNEPGISDLGDLTYKFRYTDNTEVNTVQRVMQGAQNENRVLSFCETLPDGTKFEYDAIPSVKVTGGTLNNPLEVNVKMAVQSDMNITYPTA